MKKILVLLLGMTLLASCGHMGKHNCGCGEKNKSEKVCAECKDAGKDKKCEDCKK